MPQRLIPVNIIVCFAGTTNSFKASRGIPVSALATIPFCSSHILFMSDFSSMNYCLLQIYIIVCYKYTLLFDIMKQFCFLLSNKLNFRFLDVNYQLLITNESGLAGDSYFDLLYVFFKNYSRRVSQSLTQSFADIFYFRLLFQPILYSNRAELDLICVLHKHYST